MKLRSFFSHLSRKIIHQRIDYLSTFFTLILAQVLTVFTGIIFARLLGPVGKGNITTVFWLPQTMAIIGALAFPQALTFFVSKNPANKNSLQFTGILWGIILGLVEISIFLPIVPFILDTDNPEIISLSRILLIYLPFTYIRVMLLAIDQGLQRFSHYNFYRILPNILYTLGIILLFFIERLSVTTITYSFLISQVLATLFQLSISIQDRLSYINFKEIIPGLLKLGIRFSGPELFSLLILRLDTLIAIRYLTSVEIGYYSVAVAISISLNIVIITLEKISFPRISSAEGEKAYPILLRQFRFSQTAIISMAFLVILFSPLIINFLYGEEFQPAIRATIILIAAKALWGLNRILDYGLRGLGLSTPSIWANGISLCTLLLIGVSLIKAFGIEGMASAVFLSNGTALLIFLLVTKKSEINPSWKDLWGFSWNQIRELLAKV